MQTVSLSKKLLSVQQTIRAVTKSADNPHFRSKYADLNEVLEVSKKALNESGIFIAQAPGKDSYGQFVETSLINAEDGQQISGRVYFSGNEDNLQKIGAAITYARRFGLKSLLAMEDTDDDGETAVGRGYSAPKPAPSAPKTERGSRTNPYDPKLIVINPPVQAALPKGPSRKTVEEKISLTSKVMIDQKKATQEDVVKMLEAFGVKSKSELNDEQAAKLLAQLEEKLNK